MLLFGSSKWRQGLVELSSTNQLGYDTEAAPSGHGELGGL